MPTLSVWVIRTGVVSQGEENDKPESLNSGAHKVCILFYFGLNK